MRRPPPKKQPPPRLPGQKFAIITLDQIFDAEFVAKYRTSARPVGLEEDPETLHKLIKCANLAIWDYNSQHKTDYRFVKIEMATWQLAAGAIFNVTFKCKNAKKENQSIYIFSSHSVSYQTYQKCSAYQDEREHYLVDWVSLGAGLGFGSHAVIAVVLCCCCSD